MINKHELCKMKNTKKKENKKKCNYTHKEIMNNDKINIFFCLKQVKKYHATLGVTRNDL